MSKPADSITRRGTLVGAACLTTAAAATALTPRRHERVVGQVRVADIIPLQAGRWAVAPSSNMVLPDVQPGSFYDQVFTRTYQASSAPPVMLLIAYGAAQSGLMKVHRPEVCYASAGFSIRGFQHVPLALGLSEAAEATSFTAWREDRREEVLYWTRISNVFARSLFQQRLVMFERGLSGVIPDGVLVRCSIMNPAGGDALGALRAFAEALVADASPIGQALLTGAKVAVAMRTARAAGSLPPTQA